MDGDMMQPVPYDKYVEQSREMLERIAADCFNNATKFLSFPAATRIDHASLSGKTPWLENPRLTPEQSAEAVTITRAMKVRWSPAALVGI